MKVSSNSEVNRVVKDLTAKGFVVTGHKTHIKMVYRNKGMITISKSPSDYHWKDNVMKDARKIMAGV